MKLTFAHGEQASVNTLLKTREYRRRFSPETASLEIQAVAQHLVPPSWPEAPPVVLLVDPLVDLGALVVQRCLPAVLVIVDVVAYRSRVGGGVQPQFLRLAWIQDELGYDLSPQMRRVLALLVWDDLVVRAERSRAQ